MSKGESLWYNSSCDRLWHYGKRVRTQVLPLRSLSYKYPWERHEPLHLRGYRLNSNTTVFLQG